MILFRLLPILFALLFILTRRVNIKVIKSNDLTVKINFNIFALVLSEDKIKKYGIKKFYNLIKNTKTLFKSFDYLISNSTVAIYDRMNFDNHPIMFLSGCITATKWIFISYIKRISASFSYKTDRNYDRLQENEYLMKIIIQFSFWRLIISALIFIYYIIKNSIKRVINNV